MNDINDIIKLPIDIIELIIINSDTVLTTYNNILDMSNTNMSNTYLAINSHKRKKIIKSDLYYHLSNPQTKYRLYNNSTWCKYIINSKALYSSNNHNHASRRIYNTIDNTVDNFINNIKLLEPIFLNDTQSNIQKKLKPITQMQTIEIIKLIDETIDIKKFNLYIDKITKWWGINHNDLPSIVISIFILLSMQTFKNSEIYAYKQYICYELNRIVNDSKYGNCKQNNNRELVCFSKPENSIIHLIQNYLGMGYSFNIGWDLQTECIVGFVYGGSNGYDCEFYDGKLVLYLSKNRQQRKQFIKDNKKITNNKNILEYCGLTEKPLYLYEKASVNYE